MKNNCTELVFILDRSGSMYSLTDDTIGGFNAAVNDHRNDDGEVYVTTVLFNSQNFMLHDRIGIKDIPELTREEYCASGSTALIDAMGDTIRHIAHIHKYAKPEDVPAHTLFIITTDGMENASTRYTADEVRRLVEHEREKYGWEFVFLASNIDAVETAKRYGIDERQSVNYHSDSVGEEIKYRAVSNAISSVHRDCMPLCACADWREEADADYTRRGGFKKPVSKKAAKGSED